MLNLWLNYFFTLSRCSFHKDLRCVFVLCLRESPTDKSKLLYKNDGNAFEENWQEREIER